MTKKNSIAKPDTGVLTLVSGLASDVVHYAKLGNLTKQKRKKRKFDHRIFFFPDI